MITRRDDKSANYKWAPVEKYGQQCCEKSNVLPKMLGQMVKEQTRYIYIYIYICIYIHIHIYI